MKLGDVEIVPGTVRYSSDKTGAMASDAYAAIIGNKLWSQFFVVLDLKNKSLYLKKIQ